MLLPREEGCDCELQNDVSVDDKRATMLTSHLVKPGKGGTSFINK